MHDGETQVKSLRLSLNLNCTEIDEPRGICKDPTNLGRWGNGNVEVRLERLEDLPYIISLVSQVLEKQIWTGAKSSLVVL